jgi:signal peptidase
MSHASVKFLANAVLGVAVIAFVVFGVGPHTGRYRTLSILSGSMDPTFAQGDAIIDTPIAAEDVRVGDVITYHAPTAGSPLITHRVVDVLRPGPRPVVKTRGDANVGDDAWTAELEAGSVWKQRVTVPRAGLVISALRTPGVRVASLYLLPFLFLVTMLWSVWGTKHEPEHDPYLLQDELVWVLAGHPLPDDEPAWHVEGQLR